MLHARTFHQEHVPQKTAFKPRSPSVASLVAWKEKFDNLKLVKQQPSFKSYTGESYSDTEECYNNGPVDDLPPSYPEVTKTPVTEDNEDPPAFKQDFSALEGYLKRKLSLKRRSSYDTHRNDEELEFETENVLQWMNALPDGDNLEEFLEAYGIPITGVDMEKLKGNLRKFLEQRIILPTPAANNKTQSEGLHTKNQTPNWKRQMTNLEKLAEDDNLEQWIEGLDVPYFRPIPETKDEIKRYLKIKGQLPYHSKTPTVTINDNPPDYEAFVPKWKELTEKMRSLKNEDQLDKWLDSLEVPHSVPITKVKEEIRKYFMHETFDTFKGKSIIFQEHNLAKDLWDKFENSSAMKQVAMVAGTTAVLGLIAVLSTTMLSFAFPSSAFAQNPFFTEVFAQYFLQRQEVAFNLLNFHAQNAKPLSTAWAKQYVLWKYC